MAQKENKSCCEHLLKKKITGIHYWLVRMKNLRRGRQAPESRRLLPYIALLLFLHVRVGTGGSDTIEYSSLV